MSIFTKSVLNSIKLDESKVALAWANYHNLFIKLKSDFLFYMLFSVLFLKKYERKKTSCNIF
jgi:hypothetical protein